MEFIDLKTQLAQLRPAIDRRINEVLDHGKFIMGPEVFELEERLADYTGTSFCISCANGTDALQIALMALGVGANDLVFTTAYSFFATAEVIPLLGAKPVFVDISLPSYNISPEALEKAIITALNSREGNPKAVIAVDLFGLPADYPKLKSICDKYDLKLIEDAAQSFGGGIGQQKCGSFGDLATTSFFPAKPLGCFGDGGAIFTNSNDLAQLCRSIRVHGKGDNKYQNLRVGLNSRLDTIQAAILLEKMEHLDSERERRQTMADAYSSVFSTFSQIPAYGPSDVHAWAQYTIMLSANTRDAFRDYLHQAGIPTQVYYPTPLHLQPAFADLPPHYLPRAELASTGCVSLPVHAYLTEQQYQQVLETSLKALETLRSPTQ